MEPTNENHSAVAKPSTPAPRLLLLDDHGLLAQTIVQTAAKTGRDVSVLGWLSQPEFQVQTPAGNKIALSDVKALAASLQGQDGLLVAPGLLALGKKSFSPLRYGQRILQTVRWLLSAAREAGLKQVVWLGAAELFAGPDPEAAVRETAPLTRRGYGRVLAPIWASLRTLCREHRLGVRLHPGRIYGPGEWFLQRVVNPLKYQGAVDIGGSGNNWISPVHVQDVAEAMFLAVERGSADQDYLVAAEPIRLREFILLTANYVGLQTVPTTHSLWLTRFLHGRMAGEQEVISCRVSSQKAAAELGWSPTYAALREGVPVALKDLGALAWK